MSLLLFFLLPPGMWFFYMLFFSGSSSSSNSSNYSDGLSGDSCDDSLWGCDDFSSSYSSWDDDCYDD